MRIGWGYGWDSKPKLKLTHFSCRTVPFWFHSKTISYSVKVKVFDADKQGLNDNNRYTNR